jgi:1-acyl-sn-glycerol-3-phosphate acyltransferase
LSVEPWKYKPALDLHLSPRERARSPLRESGLSHTAGHLAWLAFMKVHLRIYHRLSVTGRSQVPREPPFVLISNHSSHLDALALASLLPWKLCDRVFPVAAGDVFFETPLVSMFASRLVNALPVWRKNCGPHAMRELRDRLLGEPCGYIIFPEGTRSRDGKMQPFKAGLGMIVAGTGVPVIPCHLSGSFEALPPGCRFPRPKKVRLAVGSPLVFKDATEDKEGWSRIVRESEAAVRALADSRQGSLRS